METVLDHNPTPLELRRLGYTRSETAPITDKVRKKILSYDANSHTIGLIYLMLMREDKARYQAYLERLPADDESRLAIEESVRPSRFEIPPLA